MRRLALLPMLAALPFVVRARAGDSVPVTTPCVVSGSIVTQVSLHDQQSGGAPIGTLIGNTRTLRVSDFGATGKSRIRVRSNKATPNLAFDAWADAAEVPVASHRDLEVSPKLVSIRASVPLRVTEQGVVRVEPRSPTFAGIEVQVACTDLRIMAQKPGELPKGGVEKSPSAKKFDLFAASKGGSPFTLTLATDRAPRLSAYESANGRTHVRFADDVVLDGWIASTALAEPASEGLNGIGLGGLGAWGTSASPWFAQRDTDVRFSPSKTAARVAVLEKGAKVALWSTPSSAVGWEQVRVYDADYDPPTGKNLWVKAADLGPSAP